jgi:hypothetical protein
MVDVFGSALTIPSRFPSENVVRVTKNHLVEVTELVNSVEKVLAMR